ncbi:MAG: hypothetical protein HY602_03505 [Parcubacteria group bacterium]|nr:hypothetical protein [Parcubacteria group bacterium]
MNAQKYVPGFSYHMEFGGPYGHDEHGVCLYGDVNHPAAQYVCDAAGCIEHPDQAALSDHQKVSFWFRFSDIRPYGKVLDVFNKVADLLKAKGWEMAQAIDNLPDTGSSIGGLADTSFGGPKYRDEAEFPPEPNAHGYNAADEFCVIVEKQGTKADFSADDIETIRSLARECGVLVFGHELSEEEE